jgi:PAS domain S-box-containing protein
VLGFVIVGWLAAEVGRLTRQLEATVKQRTAGLKQEVEEHKQTSERLERTLQLFRQVTENIAEVFWVTDPLKQRISYVSPEFEKVWGQPRRNVYVSPAAWLEAVHPEDRDRITRATKTKQVSGEYHEEFRVVRPDQTVRWVRERAFPVKNEKGDVYRVVGITEDITDRVRLERQILEISDREQARIGQDLHDSLCQKLISMAFDMRALRQQQDPTRPSELLISARVAELLDETITESRRVSRGLYPVRLESEGLVPALDELAGTVRERFKVQCTCNADGTGFECGISSATHLYRIAQEAVNNALKHGRASNILIRLSESNKTVQLAIEDNGVGIGDTWVRGGGMGCYIMEYRARALGGALQLSEAPGGGTVVTCRIPAQLLK